MSEPLNEVFMRLSARLDTPAKSPTKAERKAKRKAEKLARKARLLIEYTKAVKLETLQELSEKAADDLSAQEVITARYRNTAEVMEAHLDDYSARNPNIRPKGHIAKDLLGGRDGTA